eukprot:NODE_125_length_17255_cov_0.877827.p5 type:complete len:310 gc:universal NODE_125_length_17255_cov_0.877827:14434-13505(-)
MVSQLINNTANSMNASRIVFTTADPSPDATKSNLEDSESKPQSPQVQYPDVVNIDYTYVIVGILFLIIIIGCLIKSRHQIQRFFAKIKLPQIKGRNKESPRTPKLLENSYYDIIDSLANQKDDSSGENEAAASDIVIYSKEPSLNINIYENLDITTLKTAAEPTELTEFSSRLSSSAVTESEIEFYEELRSPIIERAMRVSQRISRKLLPSFLFLKNPDGTSRRSSRYFYDESQIYSLEHSEKIGSNPSLFSDLESSRVEQLSISTYDPSIANLSINDIEKQSITICFQAPYTSPIRSTFESEINESVK